MNTKDMVGYVCVITGISRGFKSPCTVYVEEFQLDLAPHNPKKRRAVHLDGTTTPLIMPYYAAEILGPIEDFPEYKV